jgi:hypothetical protein
MTICLSFHLPKAVARNIVSMVGTAHNPVLDSSNVSLSRLHPPAGAYVFEGPIETGFARFARGVWLIRNHLSRAFG